MTNEGFSIRRTEADDWVDVRTLRLEMLRDTPLAFGETELHALTLDEAEWRMRAARGVTPPGIVLAAIDLAGRWLATMGGYVPDARTGGLLVGVYVTPDYRGRDKGVFDALLSQMEDWARGLGDTLTLHVHEANSRARAAYLRRGFVETGHRYPYVLDPTASEIEMVKTL